MHPLKLDVIKEYMRIDGHEDDRMLRMFDTAAEAYMKNGGVHPMPSDFSGINSEDEIGLYVLARLMLISHWYENRIAITPAMSKGSAVSLPMGFESILIQLRLREVEPWPIETGLIPPSSDTVSPS